VALSLRGLPVDAPEEVWARGDCPAWPVPPVFSGGLTQLSRLTIHGTRQLQDELVSDRAGL
jgi:hypothetical protein